MTLNSALLLGGCGGFGRAFAGRLRDAGVSVTTADVDQAADVYCDVMADLTSVLEILPSVDLVLMCLSEPLAMQALDQLDAHVGADQVLVDICSVKTNICARAQERCVPAQYLSLHPMFGPERTFQDQNAVTITLRDGPQLAAFLSVLEGWGIRLLATDASIHDQTTAMVQVLAHATLLTFAQAQHDLEIDERLMDAMTTPIFRSLDATAQGLLGENPQLYHYIQTANPHGAAARKVLSEAATSVTQALGDAEVGRVIDLFARLKRDPG